MTDVRGSGRGVGDAADRNDAAPTRQLLEEAPASVDLGFAGTPVGGLGPRVRRHDVPAERVFLELQLFENGADDRRGRLGGARAGQLAFRRERQAADAGAAVTRGLADQEEAGVLARRQIAREATP